MTGTDLAAALAALFGTHKGALADAGRAFEVDASNLWRMIKGQRPVPAGLAAQVRHRLALSDVMPPPSTLSAEDRDQLCCQALALHLDNLLARAIAAGWQPSEVCAAVIGWTTHQAP